MRLISCEFAVDAARLRHNFTAMEFVITAAAETAEADDSWLPGGTRSFLFHAAGAGLETHCVYS